MNRRFTSMSSPRRARHPRGWPLLLAWMVILALPATAQEGKPTAFTGPEALDRIQVSFTGDLPEITERGLLRVLISYSRTNYFIDFATARGFEYDLLRQYEKHLNEGRKVGQKIIVVFIPAPLESLLSELADGRGDIAAGGLTVTEGRGKRVAFAQPYLPNVREIVVSGARAQTLESFADLGGHKVWVRKGSSYGEHLRSLSERLRATGQPAIEVVEAPAYLATEDLLELVNAGVVDYTVTDEHIATAWAGALPNIRVHSDLAVHSGGAIAWAIRADNPELMASLDGFVRTIKKGTLLGNILFKRYFSDSKWISNPLSNADQQRLEKLGGLFQKYGEIYGFDWLALAAMAYQESGLDQGQRSGAGAVGVMQIRPSTAADKNVGITPIDTVEKNIHAGTKYLAFLRDRYFSDPEISDGARLDFTLAAYNAGPARVASLRSEAAAKGYDPNRWFGNVETIAAARIGRETVTYVSNINKYYMAYTDFYRGNLQRELQIQSLESAQRN